MQSAIPPVAHRLLSRAKNSTTSWQEEVLIPELNSCSFWSGVKAALLAWGLMAFAWFTFRYPKIW